MSTPAVTAHPVVVQKYGGSSVATPEKLSLVADRVAKTVHSGRRVVVVVSAMGKTTDEMIALAKRVSENPPRRELDMLVSTGERISMALLAMALEARGVPAISFTGSQSGIMTNDRHSGARIIEVRPIRIEDELERGKVVIVAGFQGMSYRREITTLGRGGSDTTAVALAAALAADCEIYSDVDGVYSADPRIVPNAHHLDELGYDAMQELAEHGAKVLNAAAIEWARQKGITIFARATSGSDRETRIVGGIQRESLHCVIAASSNVIEAVGENLLPILVEERVRLRAARPGMLRFVRDDLPDWPRIAARLTDARASLHEQGEVSVVGPGIGTQADALQHAINDTAACTPVLAFEASPLRITVTIAPTETAAVSRILHRRFCERA